MDFPRSRATPQGIRDQHAQSNPLCQAPGPVPLREPGEPLPHAPGTSSCTHDPSRGRVPRAAAPEPGAPVVRHEAAEARLSAARARDVGRTRGDAGCVLLRVRALTLAVPGARTPLTNGDPPMPNQAARDQAA